MEAPPILQSPPPQSPTKAPVIKSPQHQKEFTGNRKSFRVEKNKRLLRIIGNDNRVVISWNTGQLVVVGNNTSVWITRNAGTVHFTGDHGRVFLGAHSEQQLVQYVGTGGRLTVMEDSEMQRLLQAEEQAGRKVPSVDRNRQRKIKQRTGGENEEQQEKTKENDGKKKNTKEIGGVVIVRKEYLIPVRIEQEDSKTAVNCVLRVIKEIKVKSDYLDVVKVV